jgi:hypothetical protein
MQRVLQLATAHRALNVIFAGALPLVVTGAASVNAAMPIDVPEAHCGATVGERTRPFAVGEKRAYFTNLQNGDKVVSPFRVAFAVSGMGVSPVKAGMIEGTGHHHILIDLPLPADIKKPIPFDTPGEAAHQHYKHFGGGETETTLSLPPGKHTLRLLFADAAHVPYYIDSQVVTVEVLPTPTT